jgi:S1-C subfamily serine protease
MWYLGVNVERAPRGIRVSSIAPRGPAHQFGLESGDYILDAGGYVVGEHEGIYYPLAQALDFGADPSGWVEFLVWNKRTFAEETLWVQLRRR